MEEFGSLELYTHDNIATMFVTYGCKTQAEFENFNATDFFLQEVISDTEKFLYPAEVVKRNTDILSRCGLSRSSFSGVPFDLCIVVGWTCSAGGMLVRSKEFGLSELGAALAAADAIKSGKSLESLVV